MCTNPHVVNMSRGKAYSKWPEGSSLLPCGRRSTTLFFCGTYLSERGQDSGHVKHIYHLSYIVLFSVGNIKLFSNGFYKRIISRYSLPLSHQNVISFSLFFSIYYLYYFSPCLLLLGRK